MSMTPTSYRPSKVDMNLDLLTVSLPTVGRTPPDRPCSLAISDDQSDPACFRHHMSLCRDQKRRALEERFQLHVHIHLDSFPLVQHSSTSGRDVRVWDILRALKLVAAWFSACTNFGGIRTAHRLGHDVVQNALFKQRGNM